MFSVAFSFAFWHSQLSDLSFTYFYTNIISQKLVLARSTLTRVRKRFLSLHTPKILRIVAIVAVCYRGAHPVVFSDRRHIAFSAPYNNATAHAQTASVLMHVDMIHPSMMSHLHQPNQWFHFLQHFEDLRANNVLYMCSFISHLPQKSRCLSV